MGGCHIFISLQGYSYLCITPFVFNYVHMRTNITHSISETSLSCSAGAECHGGGFFLDPVTYSSHYMFILLVHNAICFQLCTQTHTCHSFYKRDPLSCSAGAERHVGGFCLVPGRYSSHIHHIARIFLLALGQFLLSVYKDATFHPPWHAQPVLSVSCVKFAFHLHISSGLCGCDLS